MLQNCIVWFKSDIVIEGKPKIHNFDSLWLWSHTTNTKNCCSWIIQSILCIYQVSKKSERGVDFVCWTWLGMTHSLTQQQLASDPAPLGRKEPYCMKLSLHLLPKHHQNESSTAHVAITSFTNQRLFLFERLWDDPRAANMLTSVLSESSKVGTS